MGDEQISNESIAKQLREWMAGNGYGSDFGVGLEKLVDEIVLLTKMGIGVARKMDQDTISKLDSKLRETDNERFAYKQAFEKLKNLIQGIITTTHWALRLGVLGCSFWFMGWRFSAGILAFILADELIRWAHREAEDIKV